MILGVASGDRPEEYPALNINFENRGTNFRESFTYIRKMAETYPAFENSFGRSPGSIDMLPKPEYGQLPLLVTGAAQQNLNWIARNSDGWMTYPRNIDGQSRVLNNWHKKLAEEQLSAKPVMQPLYVDLVEDSAMPLQPIHLGFRTGVDALCQYLKQLESIGINHVALNLRFNALDMDLSLIHI